MIIEVIATSLTDAIRAEQGGADRIELITGILEGGLTPSYGVIEAAVQSVSIPVYVMVRPHSQSFCYRREELSVMLRDIGVIKQLGAAGVVVGALTEERRIDIAALELILREAEGLGVTFHRAFDEAGDQEEALQILLRYPQIERILTSGGKNTAPDAVEQLQRLVALTEHTHLSVMAGGGLKPAGAAEFAAATGVRELHFGTGVRGNDHPLQYVDPQKLSHLTDQFRRP